MVAIKTLISSVLFVGAVIAQDPTPTGPITTNFSSSDIQGLASSGDPDSGTKLAWCSSQRALCGTLCSGNAQNNTCMPDTLSWTCTCASNNSQPALQYYPISMIGNECNKLLGNCLAKNANDLSAQNQCQKTYICGNATEADASQAAAAAASPSASNTAASSSATGSAAAGSATASQHKAGAIAAAEYAPPMFIMVMLGAIATFL